jgi:hypothetical protein
MNLKYEEWINNWNINNDPYGKCSEVTLEMQKIFPELIRVRGHYWDAIWGEREHWWLIDPSGETIDPTSKQFPTKGHGEYIQWNEGDPEPTGICPNCGDHCYHGNYCCSEKCNIEFAASMGISYNKG